METQVTAFGSLLTQGLQWVLDTIGTIIGDTHTPAQIAALLVANVFAVFAFVLYLNARR